MRRIMTRLPCPIRPNWALLPRCKRGEKVNKDRSCATIGKNAAALTASPSAPDPAAHNAAETRGICRAQRSLGGN